MKTIDRHSLYVIKEIFMEVVEADTVIALFGLRTSTEIFTFQT